MEDNVTSFEDLDQSVNNNNNMARKNIASNKIKNRFYRTAQNFANRKCTTTKWRQLIDATRNKVIPFSRSQDSCESDCTPGGENTDYSINSSQINTPIDVKVKRKIFAKKLDRLSLSQPVLHVLRKDDIKNECRPMNTISIRSISALDQKNVCHDMKKFETMVMDLDDNSPLDDYNNNNDWI